MSAPPAYLRCDDCDVRWTTTEGMACWFCGRLGRPGGFISLLECAPSLEARP